MIALHKETVPFFLLAVIGAFCGDIFSYFLFDWHCFSWLLILFVMALSQPLSVPRSTVFLLFLALESFFFYGRPGLSLIYAFPLMIMASRMRDRFWSPLSFTFFALVIALSSQLIIIEYYLLDNLYLSGFTFFRLFITIVVTILLSII